MFYAVSLHDIQLHPDYDSSEGGNIEEILHKLGLDTNKEYWDDGRWLQDVTGEDNQFDFYHRATFSQELVKCPRYIGVARSDGSWTSDIEHLFDVNMYNPSDNERAF